MVRGGNSRNAAENARANLGIAIALAAFLLSAATFFAPLWIASVNKDSVIESYLRALVGVEKSAYVARGMAAEGSQADQFAGTIGVLWEAVADSEVDIAGIAEGSVTGIGEGNYSVCFPALDLFRDVCSVYGNFELTEGNRVARFTIDGQPVEQLFRSKRYDKPLTSVDGSNQMRAFDAGRLWDSDSKEKVILLWVDRGANVSSAGRGNLTLNTVMAQDGEEAEAPIIAASFPASFAFYDAYYAAVRVPDEARFLWVCWTGAPDGESPCDWIYSIR